MTIEFSLPNYWDVFDASRVGGSFNNRKLKPYMFKDLEKEIEQDAYIEIPQTTKEALPIMLTPEPSVV